MSSEFPPRITEGLLYNREKARIVESLFRKSIDILTEHGEPERNNALGTRILLFLNGNPFPLKKEEILHSTRVRKLISDEEINSSVEVSIISLGKRKPSEARAIAIIVPFITGVESDLDTLLLTRSNEGEFNVQLWNGIAGNIIGGCHVSWRVSVDELKAFSQMLMLLQENLNI